MVEVKGRDGIGLVSQTFLPISDFDESPSIRIVLKHILQKL